MNRRSFLSGITALLVGGQVVANGVWTHIRTKPLRYADPHFDPYPYPAQAEAGGFPTGPILTMSRKKVAWGQLENGKLFTSQPGMTGSLDLDWEEL